METTDVLASTATSTDTSVSTTSLADVSGEDFLSILIEELQTQDPFEPMGTEEMVAQISTIRELELNTRLSETLEVLTDQQRFGSAGALIGNYVEGTVVDEDGNEYAYEGIVTGVRFTEEGEVILELDTGEALPLANIESITDPADVVAATEKTATTEDAAA